MEPIEATFELIKVEDSVWDVVILADKAVLKSFIRVYDNLFYVEESIFNKKPAVIVPDFPNQIHANSWKQYWIEAFSDPDNACKSCPTVNQLLKYIENALETKT